MPKMFSANPRVSRTDNSKISSSSNNKMITKSTRLSQLSQSSKLSVNRTLANVFGPTDIFLSSYTLFVNVPIGTEIARISSKDINSFSFVYTVSDNSLFYIDGDKLKINTIFTDRVNFDGHSVRITTDDGLYKFSKTFFIPFQRPPVVSNIVDPRVIVFGTNSTQINLSNTFFDVNGDSLTITAISDNPGLVSTNINGYMLTTTYSNNSGTSVITLNAYDSYNEFAVTTFSIVILPTNVDYNVTINELPPGLPEPVDIIIDGILTSFTQLDNTYINILIDELDNATEEEKRDNVKSNISSIINKYITTSQDDTVVDLYIPIDALPFPQLASNIDKVRIIDGSTSTSENPLSVNLTDNIENSAMYVNTTPGNKVTVTLSSDTLTIEQVTKDIFNVSINGGVVETKNAGDFVVMPTSEIVITLSSIIIAENHAPISYDINYTVSEDSIQNVIELNGYDVDINSTSKNYIQYVIETAPQYGVLDVLTNTDLMNKQIKYTPSENYFGSDSFSYYVKDNYGVVSNTANTNITITNVDDPATGTLTITGTVEEGGTVSYSSNISDVDGTITFAYQWQVSDDDSAWVNIAGAIGTNYNIPSDQSLVDKYIRVTAITTDSQGGITNFVSNSSQVINVDDLATGTLTMTGTVEEGGALSYSSTINDVDGTITFTYQWQVSDDDSAWNNITGATEANYNIPSDQSLVDKYIRITAITTDSRGGITPNFVSNSSQVINVDDLATGTLTITGTVEEGGTLSYSSTINDVDGTITFTYQWQVSDNDNVNDWANINGATEASYIIPSDQSLVDKYIRLTAVTTDSRGGTTNLTSPSSIVTNVNDQPTGQFEISGIVMESMTISANTTNITDEDGILTYTYQWELSDDDSIWAIIPSETNQTYAIPKDQGYVGKYVRVKAQATDPYNNLISYTSPSREILVFKDPPDDIQLSGNEVYEAYEIGQEIGTLTTSDVDSTSFTYEVDSNLFSINNNKLFSNHVFSYGSTNTYTINITTKDDTLNEFTKAFVITVKRLWVYTTLTSTEVAIGNNTTDLANGTVLGISLTGSIIIPSTIEDVNGNTYDVTNIYQNAFTGSSLEKITFSGDTTYNLDIPLKQVFQVIQTEEEYVLHQLEEV